MWWWCKVIIQLSYFACDHAVFPRPFGEKAVIVCSWCPVGDHSTFWLFCLGQHLPPPSKWSHWMNVLLFFSSPRKSRDLAVVSPSPRLCSASAMPVEYRGLFCQAVRGSPWLSGYVDLFAGFWISLTAIGPSVVSWSLRGKVWGFLFHWPLTLQFSPWWSKLFLGDNLISFCSLWRSDRLWAQKCRTS